MSYQRTHHSKSRTTKAYRDRMKASQKRLVELREAFESEFISLPDDKTTLQDWVMWLMVHEVQTREEMQELVKVCYSLRDRQDRIEQALRSIKRILGMDMSA